MTQAPTFIRYSGPIASRLLRLGMPMGPNLLLTVRGRTSGLPRTTPVAVVDTGGRRWVVGTFGEVHWVRNLRAARQAEIRVDGRPEPVTAAELSHDDATAFYRDILPTYMGAMPVAWRAFTRLLVRLAAPDILANPEHAATRFPVFELAPVDATP